MRLSRRNLLLASAGAAVAPRLAHAQSAPAEKPAVVLVFLKGSYNALFSAPNAYVPKNLFGCTADNVRELSNGLVVDRTTLGSLPDPLLERMCTVGVHHGASGHDFARQFAWFDGKDSFPLKLAHALGGDAAFRCVHFGDSPGDSVHLPYQGVVMTGVPDLTAAVTLTTSGSPGARRDVMARALQASLKYADGRFAKSPNMLRNTWDGTHTLIGALQRPPPVTMDWSEIATAYGLSTTDFSATSFTSQLAGTELLLRAGADVACVTSHRVLGENWDTHGDGSGELSRGMMNDLLPSLRTFLERTFAMEGRNVVTVLWGEFARIGGVPGRDSGHANGISATVFGKYVKNGTTGVPDTGPPSQGLYRLPMGTPGHAGFRSFLTAAARAPQNPWGSNQHPSLLL